MPNADASMLLVNGPADAPTTVILAHGAGAPMDSAFMEFFAAGIAEGGVRVARFEFPYMAGRRTGIKRPPDREDVLRETWHDVIRQVQADRLIIGGKSLGGRIASMIADEARVDGLVCLGYPFHPVGKPDQLRVAHLTSLKTPVLIVQGERDPFGSRDEVVQYPLAAGIRIHWLPDGDHGFKPRKAAGRTEAKNWQEAVAAIRMFIDSLRVPEARD